LDIETAPNLAFVWGLFKENIHIGRMVDAGYVMCWSAQWLGQRAVMFDSIHRSTPKAMLRGIHDLLNEADIVVHYNGQSFDIPTLNKEFITHGMLPPAPYKQIDLYKAAKGNFRFPSNKLEYILKALSLGSKQGPPFELWVACMKKEDAAWKKMERYNKNDVRRLGPLYLRMRPWIKNHPNLALYSPASIGTAMCPQCGSTHLQQRGTARTTVGQYIRYQCQKCGTWSRGAAPAKRMKGMLRAA
jgi:predicted RNA-binding Zn-ribbon protein involved in translation (DUF1610 family)